MFCKEKPRGTVASHAWLFLLRRIRLEALSCRRQIPEKRNTSIGTTEDKLCYVKLNHGEPSRASSRVRLHNFVPAFCRSLFPAPWASESHAAELLICQFSLHSCPDQTARIQGCFTTVECCANRPFGSMTHRTRDNPSSVSDRRMQYRVCGCPRVWWGGQRHPPWICGQTSYAGFQPFLFCTLAAPSASPNADNCSSVSFVMSLNFSAYASV